MVKRVSISRPVLAATKLVTTGVGTELITRLMRLGRIRVSTRRANRGVEDEVLGMVMPQVTAVDELFGTHTVP